MGCCCGKKSNAGESSVNAPQNGAPTLPYVYQTALPPLPVADDVSLTGNKIVVGVYDYKACEEGDVSFVRGDRMVVLSDTDSDWWTVRHLTTHQEGLIPYNFVAEETSIESKEWFFGKISRKEAEKLLLDSDTPRGCFLIRDSERDPVGFSLSIKDKSVTKGKHVKHYRIKLLNEGEWYFITRNKLFESLQALVLAYSENAMGMCHALTVPCPKPRPELWDLSSNMRDKWEIDRTEITLEKKLGSGNFGEVWFGMWKNKPVAVKTLKPGSMSPKAFLEEAAIMKKFRHNRLVALYAVCSKQEPIMIVQEFVKNGSLLDFLRSPAGKALSLNDLVYIAAQIASGMDYLEKQHLIHRDIAARNILVGDNNMVKICDFGLARLIEDDEYCPKADSRFPVKWTAPEAIFNKRFTIKSDVWSFGILLMEIFTYGQVPYPGMNGRAVIDALERGYIMPKPTSASLPDKIYEIMVQCWDQQPEKRPTFEYLKYFFEDYIINSEMAYLEPEPNG